MKKILSAAIILAAVLLFWKLFLRDINPKGEARLTWNASAESDLKGYRIYYGTEKRKSDCPQGGYAKKIDAGKNNSYQVDDLDDGKTYYFSVTSVNFAGKESCFSEEMSKTIKMSSWDKIKAIF